MKIKVGILVFLTSILTFSSSFSAAENITNTVEKEENVINYETTSDLNVLYERALNGISDRTQTEEEQEEQENLQNFSMNSENSFPAVSKINVSTSQLLETKEVDDQLVKTYETTTFTVLQDKADYQQQLKLDRKNKEIDSIGPLLTLPRENWDKTYGVKSYSTITYSEVYDDNSVRHLKMSRVTGGWSYNGVGNYSLHSRKFIVGQVGWSRFGTTSGQRSEHPWSSNSFIFGVPSTWNAVAPVNASAIGVNTWISITAQGSTWTSHHQSLLR